MNKEDQILQILEKLTGDMSQMQGDVSQIKTDMSQMQGDISQMKTDILQMQGDISQMQSDISVLQGDVSGLQSDVSELKNRVSGLEGEVSGIKGEMLSLRADVKVLKEDQADMRETLTRVAITQENTVLSRLSVLAEGHDAILSVCAPREQTGKRLDALESDMSVVKDAVRIHSRQLAELEKKAQ